ncbi:MAG: transcription factor [Desulfovibrionaceae bacterium]
MVENAKEIVLDGEANKVFVGPNKQFSIVIDEFDGKQVKAWHIETAGGKKSPNLATRADGKHIDLVIGKACRSTDHFIKRYYSKMYDETLAGKDSFK